MKTRIRFFALMLAFLLALPLFSSAALAAEAAPGAMGTATQSLLESTAIEYVDRYVQTAFRYEQKDFSEKTLLAVAEESKLSPAAYVATHIFKVRVY